MDSNTYQKKKSALPGLNQMPQQTSITTGRQTSTGIVTQNGSNVNTPDSTGGMYSLPTDRYNSYADIPSDIEGNYGFHAGDLGYEGIDTRGLPEFDNTRYGSVIYDLKGRDLERKNANSPRFSLKSNQNQTDLRKQEQYSIIANSNPADDDYHTWIRSASDIRTYEEALQEDGWAGGNIAPDYTEDMIEEALYTGNITVYSSYPIGNGVFVTPSKIEAQNYAGSGQVYSTTVPLKNIAWIDSIEGQYADTELNSKNNSSTITSRGDDDVLDERGLGLGTQQRQGENAEVGESYGRTDSDSIRDFDGILLRKWERLNVQQIREISDKLRTIIANNEDYRK